MKLSLNCIFRHLFLTLFLLSSSPSLASPSADFFDHLPCKEPVSDTLGQWRTQDQWVAEVGPGGGIAFRSPTHTFGTWVSVVKTDSGTVRITKFDPGESTEITFQGNKCEPTARIRKLRNPASASKLPRYTDQDLAAEMKRYPSGVVFAWSPHMPLSLLTLPNLKKAASQLKMHVTLVMDPFADQDEAQSEAKKAGLDSSALKRISSMELTGRGLGLHYPTFAVYSNGALSSRTIKGFKESGEFLEYLKEMREEVRQ